MCMWLHVGLCKYIPAAVAAVSELLSSREITFGPREPWKVILDLSMIPVGKAKKIKDLAAPYGQLGAACAHSIIPQ